MERYSDVMCPIDRVVMSTEQHNHAAFFNAIFNVSQEQLNSYSVLTV